MSRVPHIAVGAPWDGPEAPLTAAQWRRLTKVLRLRRGDAVSYTDGLGAVGTGTILDRSLVRGEERRAPRGRELWVAAAPPASRDRQRFLVEKLAELGVARLLWLRSERGKGRVASGPRLFAWALSALEQSRGAWLMETDPELVDWGELAAPVVVCRRGGPPAPPHGATVVVGPEGGFADGEIPPDASCWGLGPTVLRVETAAVAAAARVLGAS